MKPGAVQRVAIVVLDGVGAGEAPDAAAFGDVGSNTLGNTARVVGGLRLPHFEALGLGHVTEIQGVTPVPSPTASFGKMRERSAGKDTTTGHWEIAGIELDRAMPTYPQGFPPEIMAAFERIAGRPALGNVVASGTAILDLLGEEHARTGRPIVYTSADSVFQIAAHEDVVPPAALYALCTAMRGELQGVHAVGRVIARPFVGKPGAFSRTDRRRDFSLEPFGPTVLDRVLAAGHTTVSVGKIDDIFAHRGITRKHHVLGLHECIEATAEEMRKIRSGLVFTNLIEFDMNYGHRNDPRGMANLLESLDALLPSFLDACGQGSLVLFTADHGNDPTTASTDHSREEVPLLAWTANSRGRPLGVRSSFADLGATVVDLLGAEPLLRGTSFLEDLPGPEEAARLSP